MQSALAIPTKWRCFICLNVFWVSSLLSVMFISLLNGSMLLDRKGNCASVSVWKNHCEIHHWKDMTQQGMPKLETAHQYYAHSCYLKAVSHVITKNEQQQQQTTLCKNGHTYRDKMASLLVLLLRWRFHACRRWNLQINTRHSKTMVPYSVTQFLQQCDVCVQNHMQC